VPDQSLSQSPGRPTPSKRRTQAERRAESARRIIVAARSLYARQGYRNTTVAQIGEEAGVSAALVSHRFGSKLKLVEEVAWYTVREMREKLSPRIANKSGIDGLCAEMRFLLESVKNGDESLKALQMITAESLSSVPEIRPVLRQIGERVNVRITHTIEAGIEEGSIRPDIDPRIQMRLYRMLRGPLALTLITSTEDGLEGFEHFCDAMETMIRRNLAPEVERRASS